MRLARFCWPFLLFSSSSIIWSISLFFFSLTINSQSYHHKISGEATLSPVYGFTIHEKRDLIFKFLECFYKWNTCKVDVSLPYSKFGLIRFPFISQLMVPKSCTKFCRLSYLKTNAHRYLHLKNYRYLFALNLSNNDQILPDLFASLFYVSSHLDPCHIHISIFENGSHDYTKLMLEAASEILSTLSINHTIRLSEEERPYWAHRIKYMAELRNKALEVIWKKPIELTKNVNKAFIQRYDGHGKNIDDPAFPNNDFDRIVFLNDVLFCPDQLLELLHQSISKDTHFTCGMDYDGNEIPLFYDTWVTRDIFGEPFQKKPLDQVMTKNHKSYESLMSQLPFQVHCCWNGVVVLHPAPFYLKNVTFRYGNASAGECPGSECTTLCRDFLKHRYYRNILVPKFKAAYNHNAFYSLFSPNSSFQAEFQNAMILNSDDDAKIHFVPPPNSQFCRPLLKNATDDPDAPPYFEDLSSLF